MSLNLNKTSIYRQALVTMATWQRIWQYGLQLRASHDQFIWAIKIQLWAAELYHMALNFGWLDVTRTQMLRKLERVFRCCSVCETLEDYKEGYLIV